MAKESEKAFDEGVARRAGGTPKVIVTPPPGTVGYDFTKTIGAKGLKLNGVATNLGSLNTIRTNIIEGKGFSAGGNIFNPDGKGGWDKLDSDNTVIESYQNTDELVLEGLGTSHEGFQNLTQYAAADTKDGLKIKDNTKKKYGWGVGSQSIAPEDLWKTLQGHSSSIRTKEDLIRLADDVDAEWNIDGVKVLMEKINKQNKTKIDVEHLSKMIRDLIENMAGTSHG